MNDKDFGELIRGAMECDTDRIMEEVNSDPSLRDVVAPDEIHEKLMKQIKEREK